MWKLCKESVRKRDQRIDVNDLVIAVSYIDTNGID